MALSDPIENACFAPNDFQSEDFSVDGFISDCKKRVSTEHLHSDLKNYYSVLKVAMIELINRDYGDFLDLSANLVGMDKQIESLALPLSEVNEEILKIKYTMEKVTIGLRDKMAACEEIRQNKRTLTKVIESVNSIELLEKLLEQQRDSQWVELDRVAMEFNRLRHNMTSIGHVALMKNMTPRIELITSQLHNILDGMLTQSLKDKDYNTLLQSLETYSLVCNVSVAEETFRVAVVEPGLREIITAKAILTSGLDKVYDDVLKFIPRQCGFMLEVSNNVTTFDILVNAIWAELVSAICTRASIIFAPGNPDVFYKNFTCSMEFLEKFEATHCTSIEHVNRLRSSTAYTAFLNKWSLPVYFQIRFHEIGGKFEGQLELPIKEEVSIDDSYTLVLFNTLQSCMHNAWSDGVFLCPLLHKFWKLTLQLIVRTKCWLCEIFDNSDEALSMLVCAKVVHDSHLLKEKVLCMFDNIIRDKLESVTSQDKTQVYRDTLEQTCTSLITIVVPKVAKYVTGSISQLSVKNLEPVHTIPRLYRRTNREVPAKPSGYVQNILKPLSQINTQLLGERLSAEWICSIVETVTEKYHDITSEVLDNVKRTEDSLLKLKRNRRSVQVSEVPEGMSDDNKIRLQLAIDIDFYTGEIQNLLSQDRIECLVFFQKLSDLAAIAKTAAVSN